MDRRPNRRNRLVIIIASLALHVITVDARISDDDFVLINILNLICAFHRLLLRRDGPLLMIWSILGTRKVFVPGAFGKQLIEIVLVVVVGLVGGGTVISGLVQRRLSLNPISFLALRLDVEGLRQREVRVVDACVGEEERHGDDGRERVDVADHDEGDDDDGDDSHGVERDFVGSAAGAESSHSGDDRLVGDRLKDSRSSVHRAKTRRHGADVDSGQEQEVDRRHVRHDHEVGEEPRALHRRAEENDENHVEEGRGGQSREGSIGNVGGRRAKVSAHVDARQHTGDGREEDAKHGEPGDARLIVRPKVLDEVPAAPALKSFLVRLRDERAHHEVQRGQQEDDEQRELQFHNPFHAGDVDGAEQDDGGGCEASDGPFLIAPSDETRHRLAEAENIQRASNRLSETVKQAQRPAEP